MYTSIQVKNISNEIVKIEKLNYSTLSRLNFFNF